MLLENIKLRIFVKNISFFLIQKIIVIKQNWDLYWLLKLFFYL